MKLPIAKHKAAELNEFVIPKMSMARMAEAAICNLGIISKSHRHNGHESHFSLLEKSVR